jgi:hypothetical protein
MTQIPQLSYEPVKPHLARNLFQPEPSTKGNLEILWLAAYFRSALAPLAVIAGVGLSRRSLKSDGE